MFYVITKGGGRGSAKCLLLLTWGEGGVKSLAYVIIFWTFFALDKMKNHKKSFKNDKSLVQMPNNLYSEL